MEIAVGCVSVAAILIFYQYSKMTIEIEKLRLSKENKDILKEISDLKLRVENINMRAKL